MATQYLWQNIHYHLSGTSIIIDSVVKLGIATLMELSTSFSSLIHPEALEAGTLQKWKTALANLLNLCADLWKLLWWHSITITTWNSVLIATVIHVTKETILPKQFRTSDTELDTLIRQEQPDVHAMFFWARAVVLTRLPIVLMLCSSLMAIPMIQLVKFVERSNAFTIVLVSTLTQLALVTEFGNLNLTASLSQHHWSMVFSTTEALMNLTLLSIK